MTGSGQRDKRVIFQRRTLDADGARLGPWGDDVKRWARVRVLKGGEPVLQARLRGVQPIEVTVLSTAATRQVDETWRITWNGADYNIRSRAPGERRDEIAFLADDDGSDA